MQNIEVKYFQFKSGLNSSKVPCLKKKSFGMFYLSITICFCLKEILKSAETYLDDETNIRMFLPEH